MQLHYPLSIINAVSTALGVLIALALGLHNIPEGLSICHTFVEQGKSPLSALRRTIFVMIPQAMMAVLSFLIVMWWPNMFPTVTGFAAGSMLFLVFAETLPNMLRQNEDRSEANAFVAVMACGIFEVSRLTLGWITDHEELSGHMLVALLWSLFAGLSTGIHVFCVYRLS